MDFPKGITNSDLAFPIRYTHSEFGCLTPVQSVLIWPFIFMTVGLVGFHLEGTLADLSLGMWLAIIWAYATLPMLYFGHFKINETFEALREIIKKDPEAQLKKAHAHLNTGAFAIPGAIAATLGYLVLFPLYEAAHNFFWLQAWGAFFFIAFGFLGGYGLASVVSFYGVVQKLLDSGILEPNPYHPDLFMGLRPLGTLAVVNALVASSGSLLFPIIMEALGLPGIFKLPGYALFIGIAIAIAMAFIVPIIQIRDHIEKRKFEILKKNEADYRELRAAYIEKPSQERKDALEFLQADRAKLSEIRLFPFETKMATQVIGSILLPFIILYLQIKYK